MKKFAALTFTVPLLAAAMLAQTENQSSSSSSTSTSTERQGSMTGTTTTEVKTRSEQRDSKWVSGERQTWSGVLVDAGCMAPQTAPGMTSSTATQNRHIMNGPVDTSGQAAPAERARESSSVERRSSEISTDTATGTQSSSSQQSSSSTSSSSSTNPSGEVAVTTDVQRTSETPHATVSAYDPATGRLDATCTLRTTLPPTRCFSTTAACCAWIPRRAQPLRTTFQPSPGRPATSQSA